MKRLIPLILIFLGVAFVSEPAFAQEGPTVDAVVTDIATTVTGDEVSASVRLVLLFTALTFMPAIILAMTPFTRFVIVFSLLRQAMGLQQAPPNQILIGLSLFLAALVMQPTLTQVNEDAIQPYMAGEVETMEAIDSALTPMREFMLSNVHRSDLEMVTKIGRLPRPKTLEDIPTTAVTSAFLLSELKVAFVIAVKVYVPFLVIDIVVASVLLGMGMMVLPPVIISLPFKILLFVLMDGWNLLVTSMVASFN